MAASLAGGPHNLRELLDVRTADLMSWLSGASEPPRPVFLQSLDLILDTLDKEEQ